MRTLVATNITDLLSAELAAARSDLTRRADRTEALAELVDRALDYAARTGTDPTDLDDLLAEAADRGGEAGRARVQVLMRRVVTDTEEDEWERS